MRSTQEAASGSGLSATTTIILRSQSGRVDSDYYFIAQNDIASDDDTFISPPDTENQAQFVRDHGSVRVVHGHPGPGKTTAPVEGDRGARQPACTLRLLVARADQPRGATPVHLRTIRRFGDHQGLPDAAG